MSQNNIIICGLPGCGKTITAALLAEKLQWSFRDTDLLIEERYQKEDASLTVRQIHQKVGNERFREFETEIIETLKDAERSVISIGGGMLINHHNARLLKEIGKFIYMKGNRQQIYERLIALKGMPSYLDPKQPRLSFEHLADTREPIYTSVADVSIDITDLTPVQTIEKLIPLIQPWII
jgi:shikimate kinase